MSDRIRFIPVVTSIVNSRFTLGSIRKLQSFTTVNYISNIKSHHKWSVLGYGRGINYAAKRAKFVAGGLNLSTESMGWMSRLV
eukprot:1139654-Amorphochlora_amoeboformis.AAC.1